MTEKASERDELVEEVAEHLYHQLDEDMLKAMGCHYSNLAQTKKRYWLILAEQCLSRCEKYSRAREQSLKQEHERALDRIKSIALKPYDFIQRAYDEGFADGQKSHAKQAEPSIKVYCDPTGETTNDKEGHPYYKCRNCEKTYYAYSRPECEGKQPTKIEQTLDTKEHGYEWMVADVLDDGHNGIIFKKSGGIVIGAASSLTREQAEKIVFCHNAITGNLRRMK